MGDRGYDNYGTDNPIYSFDFNVNSDMGIIHSSAYVIDATNVKDRTQLTVRWYVAPWEEITYWLTIRCKK